MYINKKYVKIDLTIELKGVFEMSLNILQSDQQLEHILQYIALGEKTKYKKNSKLYYRENGYYLVLSGEVIMIQENFNGNEIPFVTVKKNQAFTIMGENYGATPSDNDYHLYAKTTTETKVCYFTQELLFSLMQKDLNLMEEVMNNLYSLMIMHHNRIYNASFMLARERILHSLLQLIIDTTPTANDTYITPFPLTQRNFAHSLNVHFTTCNKILKELRDDGIIEFKDKNLYIYDKEKLENLLYELASFLKDTLIKGCLFYLGCNLLNVKY